MSVITLPKTTTTQLRELGRLQDIPAVRQLGVFALAALAIAIGLWLFFWTQKPDYVPVFAGLDAKATSEASDLLRSASIPFRIDSGSGALAVPQDQLGNAKLALAAAGLPASTGGFASMTQDQGFGTSQFVENARYQHALENELARTISNLRPVREARVHLALPKPSAFTRQREPASASVVLQMQSGSTLEPGQVDAIVHLVASSIPELPTQNVTVVDQFGRMLSNPDPTSDEAIGAKQFEQRRRQEAVYVQRIQELLEPMTGRGRVSAQVSVDMDFAQTEEAREIYGPDAGLVRSEQVSESGDIAAAGAAAQGVPGATANTPTPTTAAAALADTAPATTAPGRDAGPSARTAVRNYELDRTLTHTRGAPVRIGRITAAVLIDNVPQRGTEGQVSYRALNAGELQRIDALVRQAIGFNEQRGDMISVVNAPFAPGVTSEDMPGPPFWENPRVVELARTILGGLAVLVFILAVLRPAFRAMLTPRTTTAVAEVITQETEVAVSLSGPGQPQKQAPRTPSQATQAALNFDEKLQVARTAVSSDPKRVANVVRNWVEADG